MRWVISMFGIGVLLLYAQNTAFKKYDLSSGQVIYKVTETQKIGEKSRSYEGSKKLLFDRYGYRERLEEEGSWNPGGEREHTLTLRSGTQSWIVDFGSRMILESEVPGMKGILRSAHGDLYRLAMRLRRQTGEVPEGNATVLGYPCRMWVSPQMRECLYRGVVLRLERNGTGDRRIEEAVKAQFGITVPDSAYKLPDFPKVRFPGTGGSKTSEGGTSERNSAVEKSQKKARLTLEVIQKRLREKKKIFTDVRRCVAESHKLSQINECIKRFSKAMGESFDPLTSWDEQQRREALDSIDSFIRGIDCGIEAENLDTLRRCRPDISRLY